jgi:predicted nucleic acid-binding protein
LNVNVFVLDSSAVLRYLDREPGAERVKEIFRAHAVALAEIRISAIQWGEIAAVRRRQSGATEQERVLQSLTKLGIQIMEISADRVVRAAEIRVDRKLAHADAFAVELTLDSPDHVLVTADYDFKAVEELIRIEFLPAK